nr:TonB-dependent siderophore receptor [Acinetobacter marinus]
MFLATTSVIYSAQSYAEESTDGQTVQTLPVITVKATESNGTTEGTGSYKAESSNTATKLALSLRETPQTVKVYTREYLDDRDIESFQELMGNITGVSAPRTDERQSVYARGFRVDYYLMDGMPSTLNLGTGDFDLGIYDRVEVVKGANGLMTGAGSPAMGLNFIRKRADSKEFKGQVSASAGSWDSYSTSADLAFPMNADGSLRGRIYAKYSDEDSFMDFYQRERKVAYGTIDYDLTDSTYLSVGAMYQDLDRDGIRWGGTPAFYTDGTRTKFDRSLTVSSDWTYWNIESTAFFANLKQKIYDDINLNVAYTNREEVVDTALLYVSGAVDKATNLSAGAISVYSSAVKNVEDNVDVYVNAPFEIAGREQEIIVGGSWNRNQQKYNRFGSIQPAYQDLAINVDALDFTDMNTTLLTPITTPHDLALTEVEQNAAYVAGRFQILDPLKIVAGARLSNWKSGEREFKNETTPYVGLVYDFLPNHTWFVSYTDIFTPQTRRDANANYLDPIVGRNYETGFKSELFDGRMNAGLSLFRIEQTNYAEAIEGTYVTVDGVQTTEQAYRGVDGVTSEGVELEVDGEINDNWGVSFGVAHFDAEDADGEEVNTNNARTTSNLFVKYKNEKWRAGAGLNYFSDISNGSGANLVEQDDYVLFNAMLGYQFDPNYSLQLNMKNILDKKYYDGIGANSMNYGEPRNTTLTFKYKF